MRAFARFATALVAAGLLCTTSARATVVNFDDLDASALPILGTYAGLDWTNVFAYTHTIDYLGAYSLGIISQENAAATFAGATVTIKSITHFDFVSAYLGAAFFNGLTVTVTGLLDGTQVYSQAITLDATGALPFAFNFHNINEVDITVTGTGTGNPFNCEGDNCSQVTMDDLTFAAPTTGLPEPAPIALLALGIAALAFTRRRTAS